MSEPADDFEPVTIRRRKAEEADMDITPMIDMTFLLLIFFIVAGKMSRDVGVTLPTAQLGVNAQVQKSVVLTVAPGDPDLPSVFKGEDPSPTARINASNPEDLDEAIREYVSNEMIGGRKNFVLVQAERGLKSREVLRVLRAASLEEVEQVYVGVLEKR